MTIVGLDDTDSRDGGMCTTYLAALLADRLRERGAHVERLLLVRLNPAVEHKTRGNAALALHTDSEPASAFELARELVDRHAVTSDPNTNPGLVVAPHAPDDVPQELATFAVGGVRDRHERADAHNVIDAHDFRARGWKNGRGLIGALAAVGAWRAFDDWTCECITYRPPARWGTSRDVDGESVFAAASEAYPAVWDTVDWATGDVVCTPHTPCPVLYGIRGDDPGAVRAVSEGIESEPVERTALFVTNQGTDAHLRDGTMAGVTDGGSYRIGGVVDAPPESRRGGHVFVPLRDDGRTIECVAFEPTKRFREHVRSLRPGDRILACGEVSDGTLKLEKFAVRDLVTTERVSPPCPSCDRTMKSAGADQGYRCRDCGTHADGTLERPLDRTLQVGWYEVPPAARRHLAKPLVRGGFDAPTHPSTDPPAK